MAKCLVRGRILGVFANSNVPTLSSKTRETVLGLGASGKSIPKFLSSEMRLMKYVMSRIEVDKATYSTSVVESAIVVCNLEAQIMGQEFA